MTSLNFFFLLFVVWSFSPVVLMFLSIFLDFSYWHFEISLVKALLVYVLHTNNWNFGLESPQKITSKEPEERFGSFLYFWLFSQKTSPTTVQWYSEHNLFLLTWFRLQIFMTHFCNKPSLYNFSCHKIYIMFVNFFRPLKVDCLT